MTKWVLVLVCDSKYLTRCLDTISSCRSIGSWEDDIVMLVDETVDTDDSFFKEHMRMLKFTTRKLPNLNSDLVYQIKRLWDNHKENPDYYPVVEKMIQYQKFHVFDTWFKQWDVVFYIDSGIQIYGDLNRMKASCDPLSSEFYAHSNGYPNYDEFGSLRKQFNHNLSQSISDTLDSQYNLSVDSFQSTVMVFNTNLIEESTVLDLFTLTSIFPIANRNDQGILNLYFYKLWKQLPLRDSHGWLYDFLERGENKKVDYLTLKYPRNNLLFR